VKSLDEFNEDRLYKDGYTNQCRACKRAYSQAHYRNNTEYYKANARKNGLKQRGNECCSICFEEPSLTMPSLIEDCTNKNIFKGFLCYSCKTALDLFKKRTDILHNAIKYLGN
jgi:hypothetical protein